MHNTTPDPDAEPSEMRSRPDLLSRRDAKRLLDGDHGGPDQLGQLFAAARTTGVHADSAGLGRVLADFVDRTALLPAVTSGRRRSAVRIALARIAAAKMVVIAALAALATGGIALAATTGTIPNPLPDSSHATTSESASTGERITSLTPSHIPPMSSISESDDRASDSPNGRTPNTSSAEPSPSLTGLCTSWLARPHVNGKADTSAAFSVLVAAAGGLDAVDGYCTALLASSRPATPSTSVTTSARTTTSAKNPHAGGNTTGKGS